MMYDAPPSGSPFCSDRFARVVGMVMSSVKALASRICPLQLRPSRTMSARSGKPWAISKSPRVSMLCSPVPDAGLANGVLPRTLAMLVSAILFFLSLLPGQGGYLKVVCAAHRVSVPVLVVLLQRDDHCRAVARPAPVAVLLLYRAGHTRIVGRGDAALIELEHAPIHVQHIALAGLDDLEGLGLAAGHVHVL